jgi:hypothetical protein
MKPIGVQFQEEKYLLLLGIELRRSNPYPATATTALFRLMYSFLEYFLNDSVKSIHCRSENVNFDQEGREHHHV